MADTGAPLTVCAGETATLDGSASQRCASAELEYRWLDGAAEVCGWSTMPTCEVTPGATTVYAVEVRCIGVLPCTPADTASVVVTVEPGPAPPDLGNSVRAIRSGAVLTLSWPSVAGAVTNTIHRGEDKGVWPSPPFRKGLTGTAESLADVPSPPDRYFYRVAGVSCSGAEGP